MYDPCMRKIKCKCQNGVAATNVDCSLRSIKSKIKDRVTGLEEMAQCPEVNDEGKQKPPNYHDLNDEFKEVSKKCASEEQQLCESCLPGSAWNKVNILNPKGFTKYPKGTTCIPLGKTIEKGRGLGQKQISSPVDSSAGKSTGKSTLNPPSDESHEGNKMVRMIKLNNR
jgi:hypothetical protein